LQTVTTSETFHAFTLKRITENGITRELYYIGGNAILVKSDGVSTLYYVHPDHLGSYAVITDVMGNVVQKCSFDAWGNRTFEVKDTALVFDRGYTGHEHLDEFGLINMNGRMYDPAVGRFLSPDPYVQAPEYSQSFNRSSYALNNPLLYTDPSGEFFFAAVGIGALLNAICWGAAISAATYTASVGFSDGGFNNWNWGDFGKSAGIGALSGAVTFGVGQMFGSVGSMGLSGELGRAFTHAWANSTIAMYTGGDPLSAFIAGGLGSLAGSAFMMYGGQFANSIAGNYAFSGLAGGVGAELTGGNFWEGAATGLMVAGLNHIQQGIAMPKRLEEKIDEAWAQERARQARANAPRRSYDVEPVEEYIPGVDFEIGKPHGRFGKRVDYVYETTINGERVRANFDYSTPTKNKTVRFVDYGNPKNPTKTGGLINSPHRPSYNIEFRVKGGYAVGIMRFQSMNHYQRYLGIKLY
jgi:RHS repeat-associated protein